MTDLRPNKTVMSINVIRFNSTTNKQHKANSTLCSNQDNNLKQSLKKAKNKGMGKYSQSSKKQ